MALTIKANSHNDISKRNLIGFAFIAGGEFSTDELYSDARTAPPGTAAQNPEGVVERLAAGAADWLWAGASLQFSAQPSPAFA